MVDCQGKILLGNFTPIADFRLHRKVRIEKQESGDVKNHPQEALTQLVPAYKLGQGLEDCEKGYCVVEEIVEKWLCENFVFDDIFPT